MEQLIQHRELIISAASKTSVTGAGDVMEDGAVEWLDKVAEIKAITQEVKTKYLRS